MNATSSAPNARTVTLDEYVVETIRIVAQKLGGPDGVGALLIPASHKGLRAVVVDRLVKKLDRRHLARMGDPHAYVANLIPIAAR